VVSKKELYKRIKIAGILSFIPFVLAGGAVAGYLTGDYIEKKFSSVSFAVPVCIGIGLVVSVIEVVRIIKLAVRIEGKV
jgi:hypothetical protein